MQNSEYALMKKEFEEFFFGQELTDEEIANKAGGIIGEEAMPLGRYIWDESNNCIEYYVGWLPRFRGDSHGKIYKDGTHEHLDTLPQVGKVDQAELDLRAYLEEKGFFNLWG